MDINWTLYLLTELPLGLIFLGYVIYQEIKYRRIQKDSKESNK